MYMKLREVNTIQPELEQQLIEVWESSVKATHTFLSETVEWQQFF